MSERPPHPPPLHPKTTILVVDDEPPLRKLIAMMLGSKDFEVLEAGNGKEALNVCKKRDGRVDLLITDILMPVMDGLELIKRFSEQYPRTKIIVMTAFCNAKVHELGLLVVRKPFGCSELIKAVEKSLESLKK